MFFNEIKYRTAFFCVLAICVYTGVVLAQANASEGEKSFSKDPNGLFVPMLIEYESDLAQLSKALAEVLEIRLGRHGVELSRRAFSAEEAKGTTYQWNVTLRRISERHLIVTIDSTDEQKSVSEVRTVSYQPEIAQLAWTMALVVEETVIPYLQIQGELPALGAGLAIIEPKEVGGTKMKMPAKSKPYPGFYSVGVGLTASGIWSVDEILTGPKFTLKGIFSPRTVAMLAVGWQGSAHFGEGNVSGSLSQIPIELYAGNIFFKKRVLKIIGWVGLSLGFSVYKSQSLNASRTDMTFQPGGNLLLEVVARIATPLEFFLQGGCNFPFVRDIIVNNGREIYSHVWVMPTLTVGLQLEF